MARPTKPLSLVEGHRTKAEIKIRSEAEAAMLTGVPMKMTAEVRKNKIAAAEFRRVKKLLAGIGKDDDLYSHVINMHCILVGECAELEVAKQQLDEQLAELISRKGEIDFLDFLDNLKSIHGMTLATDKSIQTKRKMIFDIDKENILTVQSALRSIPKKPEEKKKSGMAEFLESRAGDG